MKQFKIWKTITIQNKPDLSDINISSYAQDMLDKVEYPVKKEEIDLVKVTVEELGFITGYATTKEICAKAKKLGLELCPPQVGPQLRVDYLDQLNYEWLFIGMEPIIVSGGDPHVFGLFRDGVGLWLRGYWSTPAREWHRDDQFVFRIRKSLRHSVPSLKICKHKWLIIPMPNFNQVTAVCEKCLEKRNI